MKYQITSNEIKQKISMHLEAAFSRFVCSVSAGFSISSVPTS